MSPMLSKIVDLESMGGANVKSFEMTAQWRRRAGARNLFRASCNSHAPGLAGTEAASA